MFTIGDLILNLYVFIYGLFWAATTASVEGAEGWGRTLPSKQLDKGRWYNSFLKIFTLGRPLDLFPLFATITFTISFFLPILWYFSKGLTFSLSNWGELITYYLIFAFHEDFLWFLINPHFGIHKFKKKYISWHPRWWLGLPVDYLIGFFVFAAIGILARGVIWWSLTLAIQLFLIIVVIQISNRLIKRKT